MFLHLYIIFKINFQVVIRVISTICIRIESLKVFLNPDYALELCNEVLKHNKNKYFLNFSIAPLWLN